MERWEIFLILVLVALLACLFWRREATPQVVAPEAPEPDEAPRWFGHDARWAFPISVNGFLRTR